MSNGSVLAIFTRSRRGRLVAVCAIVACAYLALVVALALASPSAVPADFHVAAASASIDRTVLNCVFGVLVSFWGVMAYLRCQDPWISRRLAGIAVLLALWILAVTIKWNTTDSLLERYLWYSYYIPMACIPPLCVSCALRAAAAGHGPWRRRLRIACVAAAVGFPMLALTNDVHQLFFTFDVPSPGIVGQYGYGPAYWAFFAYSAACYLGFFAILWRASRVSLRGLVVPAAALALAGGLFCAAYALRIGWAASLNFSLIYGVVIMTTLGLCLDLGLIPSTWSFARVFDELPFDLAILSRDGSVYRKTRMAGPVRPAAAELARSASPTTFTLPDNPEDVFFAWPLSGGSALLTQDMSGLRALNRTLARRGADLERDRRALEHERDLAELLAGLEAESRLVGDVDAALSASMAEVSALLRDLPEAPDARRRQLERARMLVAYCKRKGSLVLAEAADPELDRDRILLIANELACDLRAVGIDCAAVANLTRHVAAVQASTLYDCIYHMAFTAFECEGPVLMYHLGERDDGTVELRAHLQSEDVDDLTGLPRTRALRERLDACDVIYSLTGGVGHLLLVARVRGGEAA